MSRAAAGALAGRRAIITGAAGGIGTALVARFIAAGALVVATDVDPERLAGVAAEGIETVACDITAPEAADVLVDAAMTRLGGLDLVVNNAGIVDGLRRAGDVSDEIWERTFAINVTAPMRLCRRALVPMLAQEHGVIVTVASIAGQFGGRAGAAYTASKHALIGLTRSLAVDYASAGIRANVIAPGYTDTDFGSRGPQPHEADLDRLTRMLETNPRVGAPAEIADLAVFLASDGSSAMNGAVVVADGGWTAL